MSETVSNDYVSMINKKGSGYNIPVIVNAIVDAAIAPNRAIVTAKKEEVDAAISGMATLKSSMQLSQKNVKNVMAKFPYSIKVSPDSNNTTASVIDASKATTGTNILPNVLRAKQSISEFSGFTSLSQTMAAARTLTITLGSYPGNKTLAEFEHSNFTRDTGVAAATVNITTSTTLAEVANLINSKPGVFAEVVQTSDVPSTFSLIVKGETGLNNAIKIEDSISSGTDANRFTSSSGSFGNRNQFRQAATNAVFKLNGLSVSREINTVTDLVPGIQLNLLADKTAAQTITTSVSSSNIQSNVESLIAELNAYKADLDKLGFLDEFGDENGELVNNAFLQNAQQKLTKLVSSPIKGYSNGNIHFVEFGIKTTKDGSYEFDKKTFDRTFSRSPEKFDALTEDKNFSSNPNVFIFSTSNSSLPQGVHTFTDSGDVLDTGTGNAKNLSRTGSGPFEFTTTDYPGFVLQTNSGTPGDFTFLVGRRVKTILSNFLTDSLS